MTTRSDYTDAEWDLLTHMPRMAAFGAMAAEEGGPVTATRELWASMMELAQAARTKYPNNPLIQEVTRAISRPDDDDEMPMTGWNPNSGGELGRAIVEKTLATAPRVRELLARRATPEDAAAYTAWVLGIARAGVGAAGGGLFGLGSPPVTASEEQYLKDLAAALGAE
jgi:hypothetical protein